MKAVKWAGARFLKMDLLRGIRNDMIAHGDELRSFELRISRQGNKLDRKKTPKFARQH